MSNIRVVVAQRNPIMRSGIACLLDEASDITIVAEARSGEQALGLADRMDPDVVVLDAQLQDVPCAEVVRQIRDRSVSTEIVVMTEQADEAGVFELIASGARGLVAKKEEWQVMLEAVRSVVSGDEVWLSPRVAATLVPKAAQPDEATSLSTRERQLLRKVAVGYRNEQIAKDLDITAGTVRNHLSNIYSKLGIHTRSEAVAWAWRSGLVRNERDD